MNGDVSSARDWPEQDVHKAHVAALVRAANTGKPVTLYLVDWSPDWHPTMTFWTMDPPSMSDPSYTVFPFLSVLPPRN